MGAIRSGTRSVDEHARIMAVIAGQSEERGSTEPGVVLARRIRRALGRAYPRAAAGLASNVLALRDTHGESEDAIVEYCCAVVRWAPPGPALLADRAARDNIRRAVA